jgi:hypothetical protein
LGAIYLSRNSVVQGAGAVRGGLPSARELLRAFTRFGDSGSRGFVPFAASVFSPLTQSLLTSGVEFKTLFNSVSQQLANSSGSGSAVVRNVIGFGLSLLTGSRSITPIGVLAERKISNQNPVREITTSTGNSLVGYLGNVGDLSALDPSQINLLAFATLGKMVDFKTGIKLSANFSVDSIAQLMRIAAGNPIYQFLALMQRPNSTSVSVVLMGIQGEGDEATGVVLWPNGDQTQVPVQSLPVMNPTDRVNEIKPMQKDFQIQKNIQSLDLDEMNRNRSYEFNYETKLQLERIKNSFERSEIISLSDLGQLNQLSNVVETAGALLVKESNGALQTVGVKVFNTVVLNSIGNGIPTDRQLEFVNGVNRAKSSNELDHVIDSYPDVTAGMSKQDIYKAEAFATKIGVMVMDKAYENLGSPFVPFHTHLGHPDSFRGLAAFAPTADDIRSHQNLMRRYQTSLNTNLTLPGLIVHASGELTLFWAGEDAGNKVRLKIYTTSGVSQASTYVEQLKKAETTGELFVSEGDSEQSTWRSRLIVESNLELWDRKKYVIPAKAGIQVLKVF